MRDREKLINEAMERAVKAGETAGVSLLVTKGGAERLYARCGHADIEKDIPMERDTIVHLYSQSKPITAAAAMILMQDGLIDLNEPVERYLDSFKDQTCLVDGEIRSVPAEKKMRILDLLNMTSGLVYPGVNSEAEIRTGELFKDAEDRLDKGLPVSEQMTTMEFADRIGRLPLQFVPGTAFRYGTGADVCGALIEKVTGVRFGDFFRERIFEPLEMKDTGFFVPEDKKHRLSKIYTSENGGYREYRGNHLIIRNDGGENAFESGGAGLYSTLDDYMHFGQMLLNNGTYGGQEILTPETVRFMTSGALQEDPQRTFVWNGLEGYTYANFLRILKDPSRAVIFGHKGEYGWDGWLGAYFMNDPETETTMIMFTQMTDYATGHLTRKLRNIVLS